ncbi:MAG TPA: hypothetical protein PKO15_16645 [Fibrobacteria bacterium]|nr:hypothetical protein [Fibrobacteria bacterium]
MAALAFAGCRREHTEMLDKGGNRMSGAMMDDSLLEHVRLAINPRFQDWVLFESGTYIIFDNADTVADIRFAAMQLMKKFGPVHVGGPAGDFGVISLDKTAGWLVSGHGYGMYTYVHPKELTTKNPTDLEIGLLGRSKRDMDGNKPVIIHVNRKPK